MKLEIQDPYERGFIDGMAKQRDSKVQQMVESYTHPAELTDEEIKDCYEAMEDEGLVDEPYAGIIYFARAILRKAQEK